MVLGTARSARILLALVAVLAACSRSGFPEAEPSWERLRDVTSAGTLCNREGWCWLNPRPHGNDLRALWGDGSTLFAVGHEGTALVFDGSTWTFIESSVIEGFRSVWATGPKEAYVVGTDGTGVLRYDGTTWTRIQTLNQLANGIWGSGTGELFIAGGRLWHFDGSTWAQKDPGVTFAEVWGTGPTNVVAVGSGGTIERFDGTAWTPESSTVTHDLNGLWGTGPNDIFAVGDQGTIIHHDGVDWSPVLSPTDARLTDVWGHGPNDVYAVGESGTVAHYDGTDWIATDLGREDLFAVFGHGAAGVVVVGEDGIMLSFDGTWSRLSEGTTDNFSGLWASGGSTVYTTVAGTVSRWSDGSEQMLAAFPNALREIAGSSDTDIHAVGAGGLAMHFDGRAWNELPSGTTSPLFGLAVSSPNRAFAAGEGGVASIYDGLNWAPAPTTTASSLYAVWANATDAVAVGDNGAVVHHDGTGWRDMISNTTQNLNDIAGTSLSDLIAVGNTDVPMRRDSSGWRPMPALPINGANLSGVWGSPATEAYVVGNGGLLARWDGSAWFEEDSGTGSHLNEIVATDTHLVIAGDGGALLVRPR